MRCFICICLFCFFFVYLTGCVSRAPSAMQFMEIYHLAKESKKEKPAYPGAGFSVSGKISSSVCSHDDIGGGVYFAF